MLCAPLCFDEQVVWELRQMVVLEVQDLELRSLQSLSQLTHLVPACQQLPQAPTGQQPNTHTSKNVTLCAQYNWSCVITYTELWCNCVMCEQIRSQVPQNCNFIIDLVPLLKWQCYKGKEVTNDPNLVPPHGYQAPVHRLPALPTELYGGIYFTFFYGIGITLVILWTLDQPVLLYYSCQ